MFQWRIECEGSFQELKSKLTSTSVLILPEGTEGYAVYCNASRVGLGCVLKQHGEVRAMPLGNSKFMIRIISNDLELAAVVLGLKIWRHYLYGVHLDVFIDHIGRQYVFTQKELNFRHRRWLKLFKDYK